MKYINRKSIAVAISALTFSVSSFAQLEVLVTAQKREQSLQTVPIAISAVSGELLEQTGVNTITEVIPMVRTQRRRLWLSDQWAIRGIGSNDWTIGSGISGRLR